MRIGIDARNLTASFSGIGRYLIEMTRHLSQAGHDLRLYLPSPPMQPLPGDIDAVVRIGSAAKGGMARRHLWAQTVLPRQAAEDRLDVFWGPAHRLPALLPARLARVVTVHDLVWHYHGDTMRRAGWLADRVLMPRAVAAADIVAADSQATADAVHEVLDVPLDRVQVVHPGIRSLTGAAMENVHPPDGIAPGFILFVGTLEPRKNLERLLRAYALLDEALREAHPLVIAGAPGWRHFSVSDLVAQLGLGNCVKVLGFVPEAVLGGLYMNCRFVAFPSLYEGFGFPIVEANHVGKPALTSSNSSMVEVAGDANLLVDATDTAAIAEGLYRLLADQPFYQALSARARPNALRFNWTDSAGRLADCFAMAVDRRANRGARHG